MDLPAMFRRSVHRSPDRTAIVDVSTGERYTYADLEAAVDSVANGLRDAGIEPGDRVGLCLANRPETAVTFLATQAVGAVAVPFNFRLPADDVEYHLRDADPRVFLFDSSSREAVARAESNGGLTVETVYYVGDDAPEFARPFADLHGSTTTVEPPALGPEDPSVILYTSGTTGDPKGIPITHESTVARMFSNAAGQGYYLRETMLGVMPLYHTVGLHGIFFSLVSASGTYLCMPQFDPETAVEAIDREGVTALHEAPTILKQLLDTDAIDGADVSSVSKIAYSGAPMSTALFEAVDRTFAPDRFTNIYGNTETYDPLQYVDLRTVDTPTVVGDSNLFHRTRIVALEATNPAATVEPGVEGELIVHTDSPAAFTEYLNKPTETAASIIDGWYFTGDAAYERDDGTVVVTGRADDLIISGGENIHPAEVEDVLSAHAGVDDVGVIGRPDEEWGEIVTAFVAGTASTADLEEWCLDHDGLADFKRPRAYEFVDTIPRNPSGKVMRYQLRASDE